MIFNPFSRAEQIMYATVPINVTYADGSTGSGTGFVYLLMSKTEHGIFNVLVTNKHVIQGSVKGAIRAHLADVNDETKPSGEIGECSIDQFEQYWFSQPGSNVDLAIMNFDHIRSAMTNATNRKLFVRHIGSDMIPTHDHIADMNVVENIIMVGYPNGLYDESNNFPIFRSGHTASHPSVDFDGRAEFVVDVACFPGSSGSPILIANEDDYISRTKNLRVQGGNSFLGILHAGPTVTIDGQIEVTTVPTGRSLITRSQTMMHLGYAIKSREVESATRALQAIVYQRNPSLYKALDLSQTYL